MIIKAMRAGTHLPIQTTTGMVILDLGNQAANLAGRPVARLQVA
jgi:hypothetical protein